jgi:hypothetical protein
MPGGQGRRFKSCQPDHASPQVTGRLPASSSEDGTSSTTTSPQIPPSDRSVAHSGAYTHRDASIGLHVVHAEVGCAECRGRPGAHARLWCRVPARTVRRLEGIAARRRGACAGAGTRQMLAARHEDCDPTLPGLFAGVHRRRMYLCSPPSPPTSAPPPLGTNWTFMAAGRRSLQPCWARSPGSRQWNQRARDLPAPVRTELRCTIALKPCDLVVSSHVLRSCLRRSDVIAVRHLALDRSDLQPA